MKGLIVLSVFMLASLLVAVPCFAAWTPLISATDFTGITADIQTTAVGIISILLVVLGVGLLTRIFSR